MAAQSRLLELPVELRLIILDYVLAELPHQDGILNGNLRGWLPPPALQTCHELRADGVRSLAKLPIHFEIRQYDVAKIILWCNWFNMTSMYHGHPPVAYNINFHLTTNGDNSEEDLTGWLKHFYLNNFKGVSHETDVKALQAIALIRIRGKLDMNDVMWYVMLHTQTRCVKIDTDFETVV
jgi:hypothetical protein